jgi:RNA polymerase sigma-70 factor, ECF subfamily
VDASSETALVERLRAGDVSALEALMERYASCVFRVARGIARTDADAEEVVQDVFLTLAQDREFRGSGPAQHLDVPGGHERRPSQAQG